MVGFLGVRVAGSSLVPVQEHERKSDDVFSIDLGGNLLDPSSLIPADRDLLVTVYIGSNKASAHPVKEGAHQMNDLDVQPASSILVKEVRDKLYAAQSLTAPF
jgi:hypothetical protein